MTTITPSINPVTLLTVFQNHNPVAKGPDASRVRVQLSAAISLAGIDLGSGLPTKDQEKHTLARSLVSLKSAIILPAVLAGS